MNADETLSRAFAEHEYLAPDAHAVLADLQRQLDDHRLDDHRLDDHRLDDHRLDDHRLDGHQLDGRRRPARLLTGLAVAATVAAVAVASALLADGDGSQPRHVAPADTHAVTPVRPKPSATVPDAVAFPDVLSIAAGWLPGRATTSQGEVTSSAAYTERDYHVRDGGRSYDVILSVRDDRQLPARSKGADARPATVNGRAAHEFVRGGFYQVAFHTADGRTANVYVTPLADYHGEAAYSGTALTRIGRHVARTMRFDAHDAVRVSGVLTYLPRGVTVSAVQTFDRGGGYTNYALDAGGSSNDAASVNIGGSGEGLLPGLGRRSGTVQGRPARVERYRSVTELIVYDFRPGITLALATGGRLRTVSQLRRIADGIHFVH